MIDFDPLDDVALLALGVLPEAEARAARERLTTDAAAAAEYRELRVVADALGLSAEADATTLSSAQSARMRAAVFAKLGLTASDEAAPSSARSGDAPAAASPAYVNGIANGAPSTAAPVGNRRRVGRARPWFARSEFLAAAAVVLAALFGLDDLRARDVASRAQAVADVSRGRIASAQDAADAAARAFRIASDATSHHYAIPQGSVVAGHGGLVLALAKLPPPPAGKVYQAWTLARGSTAMSPSVTFRPSADGSVLIDLPVDASGLTAVAVSVEPEGGSAAPTTKPTFVRTLG